MRTHQCHSDTPALARRATNFHIGSMPTCAETPVHLLKGSTPKRNIFRLDIYWATLTIAIRHIIDFPKNNFFFGLERKEVGVI